MESIIFPVQTMLSALNNPDALIPTGPIVLLMLPLVLWVGTLFWLGDVHNEFTSKKLIPMNFVASIVCLAVAIGWALVWYYN